MPAKSQSCPLLRGPRYGRRVDVAERDAAAREPRTALARPHGLPSHRAAITSGSATWRAITARQIGHAMHDPL